MRITLATPMRDIGTIAAALGITPKKIGEPSGKIYGIATDSREILPGDMFLAMRGECHNGNDFIEDALLRGAAAVLCDSESESAPGCYWQLSVKSVEEALLSLAHARRLLTSACVIAVSGSTGKTTVKEIIASVLSEVGTVRKSEGNFNSTVGMPLSLLGMEEADFLVLELGINHPGEMERLSLSLAPSVTVLTNVGSAHVGQFESAAALLSEKLKITAGQQAGDILLLADTIPREAWQELPQRTLTVGTSDRADFHLVSIKHSKEGVVAALTDGTRTVGDLRWHIPGSIGLCAVGIAGAIGLLFGVPDDGIRLGLARAAAAAPRMKTMSVAGLHVIDDTYNASPEAVIAALEALAYLGGAHTAAVLGDIGELGEVAELLHDAVGECAAHSGISSLFTYGHYAEILKAGALRGGMSVYAVHAFDFGEEQALAAHIRKALPLGTTVLFKASRKTALERVIKELKKEE